ncbi:hypothetical protein DMUE_0866 [Dictyocoela muelleri]|nr:hypothetical protein DMUE_0866 [Dictyocoela muelleri]
MTQNTWKYNKMIHMNCSVRLIKEGDVFYAVEGDHMYTSEINKIYILQMKEILQYKINNRPHLTGKDAFKVSLRDPAVFIILKCLYYQIPSFDSLKTSIYNFKSKILSSSNLNAENWYASYFEQKNVTSMLLNNVFSVEKIVKMWGICFIGKVF